MSIEPGVWGIDLGQCALKALRLEVIDGQVTATAFDYVEHPKILSQPDADPDQLTREALEKFLERNDLKGDMVAISIPGQSGLARFVKLPPVEEKKINDIVRFEAKQQIPFNLDEVVWDYQRIGSGLVTDGFAMETEIGLFAIKRDTVNRYLQHFKDVNVEVHAVQMAPLALCNYVAHDLLNNGEGHEAKSCVVALDIGTDNSNLVITDGQRIIWQRPIPLGGNHFTRALTKDLKLTFAKAEHLKRNATKSPDLKKILASLKPVLNDFVGEVQRSLGYFTNTHRDASIEYMMGLGSAFRLPGLQKFLAEKLSLDVRKLTKLERLAGDTVVNAPAFTENMLSFAVAHGLALQGLGVTKLTTNLLPNEIRVDRLIRAKKPYAVTAAAALLFGTSVTMLGYATQFRAYATDRGPVKSAVAAADTVVKEAANWNSKCATEQQKIDDAKKGVKSIIAGQEERINWLELTKFLDEALPKPDASNLTPQARKDFFLSDDLARAAWQAFEVDQIGKTKQGAVKLDEEEKLTRLIQVNLEGITCRFAEDLSPYLTKLKGIQADMESMDAKDKTTPPEGKGWVVELRGYTYHRQGRRFVFETFLENLKRLRRKDGEGTAVAAAPDAAKPAAGGEAAPADGETKPPEDPVLGKVSHVVLYKHVAIPNPEGTFTLINNSIITAILGGAGAGGGPGMPGGMRGYGAGMQSSEGESGGEMAGPTGMSGGGRRDSWAPLGGGGGGAGFGGGGMMGMAGGPSMGMAGGPSMGMAGGPSMGMAGGPSMGMAGGPAPSMPGGAGMGRGFRPGMGNSGGGGFGMRGGGSPGLPGTGGEGEPGGAFGQGNLSPEALKKARLLRTEFTILFIWKEPTNSDSLLAAPEDTGLGGLEPGS